MKTAKETKQKPWLQIPKTLGLFIVVIFILAATVILIIRTHMSTALDNNSQNILAAGWQYMPGVAVNSDGLHVNYLGRAIVQQNGSPGQSNPPVNVYGTHLGIFGDYTIAATIQSFSGSGSLQFYSEPPIVEDEFRIIPKSLEVQLSNAQLTISVWNGDTKQKIYSQKPILTKSYPIHMQPSNTITLVKTDKQLSINMNGQQVAALPGDSLKTSAIWFGLSANTPASHWTLAKLVATGSISPINTQSTSLNTHASDGLQTLARQKRSQFLVGAAMPSAPPASDATYAQLAFGGNFGSMTPENAMKWQFIHPQPTTYDFKEADGLVDLARKNGLIVHGHTLVFGEANPNWVQTMPYATDADKSHIKDVMIDHISQTVGHFKGRVAEWDVVNEPLAEDVSTDAPYRDHIWYKAMGKEYIATAFRAAHAADPSAKLYINEFGLEDDGDRWNAFLALITQLKADGVPIDGVGFQAHVYEQGDEIDPAALRSHIEKLASLGLVSRISEMDVYSDNGTDAQAEQYAGVFDACFAEPSCVSWTTWGITDRYDYYIDDSGRLAQGQDFLWDKNDRPIPALTAIKNILTK